MSNLRRYIGSAGCHDDEDMGLVDVAFSQAHGSSGGRSGSGHSSSGGRSSSIGRASSGGRVSGGHRGDWNRNGGHNRYNNGRGYNRYNNWYGNGYNNGYNYGYPYGGYNYYDPFYTGYDSRYYLDSNLAYGRECYGDGDCNRFGEIGERCSSYGNCVRDYRLY